MPRVKVQDEKGHTMNLNFFNGRYYSTSFNEEALANMSDFPLREDDVLLCSYCKSGSHWIWEIIKMLLNGNIRTDKTDLVNSLMEWKPFREYSSLSSPRMLMNHLPFDLQPRDLLVHKSRVIFLYRNFKDVAVSFFHHHRGIRNYEYSGDFEGHLQLQVSGKIDNGSPFEYIRSWEKGISDNPDLPVFVVSYEDLKENSLSEVRRLSKFLGKDYNDEFLQQVCDITNFEKMKELKGDSSIKAEDGRPVMYRKGQVGDWKNHFTVALNEWFDEIIQQETAGSKLKFTYTI